MAIQEPKNRAVVEDRSSKMTNDDKDGKDKPAVILSDGDGSARYGSLQFGSRGGKAKYALLGLLGLLLILMLVLFSALNGGSGKNKGINVLTDDSDDNQVVVNNNSSGYVQSPNGNFGSYTLDTNYALPTIIVSKYSEAALGEPIQWQNGFTTIVTSVERDYRPASEFDYKRIAETGDELVRVNFLVANATDLVMPIGYLDLAFYSINAEGVQNESERIAEDVYSPKNGQTLGGRQTQKVSQHYRVKRGSHFDIVRTKTLEQPKARISKGEEKFPVLSFKIYLPQ